MLVLSRRVGEEIVLPHYGVTIGVVTVRGGQVRLAIAAPSEVPVHRGEVWERIREAGESDRDARAAEREPMRVLIADADQALSQSYRESLGERGYEVHIVTNGLECISCLRERPPHVLVLDPEIHWGGGDGVLALMREEHDVPAVPVLLHTSRDDDGLPAEGDFLVVARAARPVPQEQMASMVRQMAQGGGVRPEV